MGRQSLTGQRLVALFLVGMVLLNYPLLSLFSIEGTFWGVPILYIYLFVSWFSLIAAMALLIEVRK